MSNHQYHSHGPRTNFGNCRPFQDFTWEHCPKDWKTGYLVTDADGLCANFPNIAMLEDKCLGMPCNKGQLMSLEALDLLIQAGANATGGKVSFASCGTSYTVTLTYDGLVFRTDKGTDGQYLIYTGSDAGQMTIQRGTCYNLDAIVRKRSTGDFMLIVREVWDGYQDCSKMSICKAIHKLVTAGMKATGGRVHPKSAEWPLKLKYRGLHLFEHDNEDDIAAGRMWWDKLEYDLTGIKRAFNFQNPGPAIPTRPVVREPPPIPIGVPFRLEYLPTINP